MLARSLGAHHYVDSQTADVAAELAKLDAKYIHAPWTAPDWVLAKAGVVLGKTYPKPIVDHDFARKRALEAFKGLN